MSQYISMFELITEKKTLISNINQLFKLFREKEERDGDKYELTIIPGIQNIPLITQL